MDKQGYKKRNAPANTTGAFLFDILNDGPSISVYFTKTMESILAVIALDHNHVLVELSSK